MRILGREAGESTAVKPLRLVEEEAEAPTKLRR
jgi:hypothetical protein